MLPSISLNTSNDALTFQQAKDKTEAIRRQHGLKPTTSLPRPPPPKHTTLLKRRESVISLEQPVKFAARLKPRRSVEIENSKPRHQVNDLQPVSCISTGRRQERGAKHELGINQEVDCISKPTLSKPRKDQPRMSSNRASMLRELAIKNKLIAQSNTGLAYKRPPVTGQSTSTRSSQSMQRKPSVCPQKK